MFADATVGYQMISRLNREPQIKALINLVFTINACSKQFYRISLNKSIFIYFVYFCTILLRLAENMGSGIGTLSMLMLLS